MDTFCVAAVAGNPHLRAPHGVMRAAALLLTADAQRAAHLLAQDAQAEAGLLVEAARASAAEILANAQAEAAQLLAEAHTQASELTAAEQQRALLQAAELLQALGQANDAILERVEDMVAGLAQALYDRLVMETTPRERIDAALRRVLHEAPPKLVDALLRVHPDDVALLPELDWPLKADAALAPGGCRLEASNGQWCANFEVAVQAVKTAFAQGIEDTRRAAGDGIGAALAPMERAAIAAH